MSDRARLDKVVKTLSGFGLGGCPGCGRDEADNYVGEVRFKMNTNGAPVPPPKPCPECGRPIPVVTLNIGTAGREVGD